MEIVVFGGGRGAMCGCADMQMREDVLFLIAIFQNPDPNCARVAPELRSNYRAITGVNDVRCWAAFLVAEQLWAFKMRTCSMAPIRKHWLRD